MKGFRFGNGKTQISSTLYGCLLKSKFPRTEICDFHPWVAKWVTCDVKSPSGQKTYVQLDFPKNLWQWMRMVWLFTKPVGYNVAISISSIPLKINMVHLKITQLKRKIIWTKTPFLCSMLIFQGVTTKDLQSLRTFGWWRSPPLASSSSSPAKISFVVAWTRDTTVKMMSITSVYPASLQMPKHKTPSLYHVFISTGI